MKKQRSRKSRSIYRSQCDEIAAIFDTARSPAKVLCVALDFAKTTHVALICDGHGDILKQSIPVHNTGEGVAFLIDQINASARRRKIPRKHIFIGGEDIPNYASNFLFALQKQNFLVVRVNAHEAKGNRENVTSSTDDLALLAIAKTLITRRCRVVERPHDDCSKAVTALGELTRSRSHFVKVKTATSNMIHSQVEILFPGFLDSSKSGITSFGKMSCELMKERFSGPQIARRKHASLTAEMRRNRIKKPEQSAAMMIALAKEALPPDKEVVNAAQRALKCEVELYECLKKCEQEQKLAAADLLAQTPYVMLTSIQGIALVLASGTGAELGDPARLGPIKSLCGYAGIVRATDQTGGPDKPARGKPTPSRCNHHLKNWAIQASQKMKMYGPPEIKERFARWEVNGQNAKFAGAKRYLRIGRMLIKNGVPYLNAEARQPGASDEVMAHASEEAFGILVNKWSGVPGWERMVFAEDRPLGFWRQLAIKMYGAELPLSGDALPEAKPDIDIFDDEVSLENEAMI